MCIHFRLPLAEVVASLRAIFGRSMIPTFWVPEKLVYRFASLAGGPMVRTLDSPRHEALRAFLIERRRKAGLRQVDLAKRLRRAQSYVTYVETGQKLVDVVELMEWADAIGFDARDAIKQLYKTPRK